MWRWFSLGALIILAACTANSSTLPIDTSQPTTHISDNATNTPKHILNNNAIKDGGFFTNEPCGIPCFFEITPGITTEEGAYESIRKHKEVFNNCNPFDHTVEGGVRGLTCAFVSLAFKNSYLYVINFTPSTPISLQQVIDTYGPPDLIAIYDTNLPEYATVLRADLFFDEIRTILSPPEQEGETINISAETSITGIIYSSIDEYESFAKLEGNVPWKGYGLYPASRP